MIVVVVVVVVDVSISDTFEVVSTNIVVDGQTYGMIVEMHNSSDLNGSSTVIRFEP